MNRKHFGLIFPILAALMTASTAQSSVVECHNCTIANYAAKARSEGLGEQLVYDFAHGVLRKYDVVCGFQPQRTVPVRPLPGKDVVALLETYTRSRPLAAAACNQPITAVLGSPEPEIQASFDLALSFYRLAGNSKELGVQLDMDDVPFVNEEFRHMSAYNLVTSNNASYRFGEWMRQGHDLPISTHAEATIEAIFQDVLGALFNGALVVDINVTFEDDTQTTYEWQLSTNRISRVPNSSTDQGNLIPEVVNSSTSQGQYLFTGPDGVARFATWLVGQGIPVTYGPSAGSTRKVVCTWDGHELRCHVGG